MKSSDKSTTKKTTTKTTKKVAEPKTKETKTSSVAKKTTAKKVKDTEVKKNTKKEIVVIDKKEEKKVTTKAKVAKAGNVNKNKTSISSEVLEKAVKEPKKSVAASKKTTAKKPLVKTTKTEVEEPIKELPIMAEEVVTKDVLKAPVPDHVTISNENGTMVINAVTPEKTVDDLSDDLGHSLETVDLALKDVANTTPIIYDGYNVSVNGKIIASFRKCIAHTDSRDFFNAITFALHNRFPNYRQELFNKVVDILDTSPSRFNVIIG